MYDDDNYVSSVPYRLMPPRKRAGSEIREALDAAMVTGPELREALDAANGTAPEPDNDGGVFWPATRQRQWPRRLGRFLARMDTWAIIIAAVSTIAAVAGVVIAYLAWVRPH